MKPALSLSMRDKSLRKTIVYIKTTLSVIFIFYFLSRPAIAQENKSDERMNVGTAIGYRAPYGLWGVFFSYQPSVLQNNIELNIGAGINHSYILGSGLKFRLLRSESGLMESMLSFNYSFNFKGELRYKHEGFTEYYMASEVHRLTYSFHQRFYLNKKRVEAIQLGIGYCHNVGKYAINHVAGMNAGWSKVNRNMNSGLFFELGLVIHFLKLKKDE